MKGEGDTGSMWTFKQAEGKPACLSGEILNCGSIVRLEHMSTRRNLHSHNYKSPLSSNQEVSAYGVKGLGDQGDDWELVCEGNTEYIVGDAQFSLKHVGSGAFLYSHRAYRFDDSNCRGCPINGQSEISSRKRKDGDTLWKVVGGYFFPDPNHIDIDTDYVCNSDLDACDD